MEEAKGRYLRPEDKADEELRRLGKRKDWEAESADDAEIEAVETEEAGITWGDLKKPVLFLALTVGICVCEYLGLMAEVIAVPGMCVCAACFGRNTRCR